MENNGSIAVVFIITKLELGGAQKVCISLFEQLLKNNVPAFLITGTQGPLVERVKKYSNVILLDSFKREITFGTFLHELKNCIKIIRILRGLKKQHPHLIVHTHSTKAGIMGRWAALFAGIKKRIHTVHGFGFHTYQNQLAWAIHYLLELATSLITTHYICVSSADVHIGSRLLPGFSKKNNIIRAAVDDIFFTATRKEKSHHGQFVNTFTFGTVACFKKQKNIFDLLQAFLHVCQKKDKVKLEIIGDGHLRSEIEQWIIINGLQKSVILHGWQQDVYPFMMRWDAFVLSSLWEGLPCSIVEARLLKLPVVCYNTGGISDVILHGRNGYLHQPKDWRQLAHSMLSLTSNNVLHSTLSNYHDNLSNFSISQMIRSHEKIYRGNIS